MIAINESYATPGDVLRDGDELAFIPPVAGG
jgi:molybdopterin synthase catalytic subunit